MACGAMRQGERTDLEPSANLHKVDRKSAALVTAEPTAGPQPRAAGRPACIDRAGGGVRIFK
jgi:hypothetical protein